MAVTISNIIPAKTAENAQTTQYTSNGVQTIIDKFTATNYSASAATISVNLITAAGSASNDNLIVKTKTLQPWLRLTRFLNWSVMCCLTMASSAQSLARRRPSTSARQVG
jgi:hypothetical protein